MDGQRGVVSVLMALLLPVILGLAAFVIDLPYLLMSRQELQNVADVAALSGAAALYRNGSLNWDEASQTAQRSLRMNTVAGVPPTSATVSSGYWNTTSANASLQVSPSSTGSGDAPAVRVQVTRAEGVNGGGLLTVFASTWGLTALPASASAVAGRTSPSSIAPGYVFPMVVSQCLFDRYWDASATPPGPMLDPATRLPYVFRIPQTFGACNSGDWSSLDLPTTSGNSTDVIRGLVSTLNTDALSIGDSVWVKPGTANGLYTAVNDCSAAGNKNCEWSLVPVVANQYVPNALNPIKAFACMHILRAVGSSSKYVEVQMSNRCNPAAASGSGSGYGVLSSPKLFF
jgi:Flp pilus assembly protein TadG